MGPGLVQAAQAAHFDPAAWTALEKAAAARDFDQTLAAIRAQSDEYAALIGRISDADFRAEIEMFGNKTTRGAFIVNLVLCGCAAYRTQLFVYLKSCGREELSTINLWAGTDAPAAGLAGGSCAQRPSNDLEKRRKLERFLEHGGRSERPAGIDVAACAVGHAGQHNQRHTLEGWPFGHLPSGHTPQLGRYQSRRGPRTFERRMEFRRRRGHVDLEVMAIEKPGIDRTHRLVAVR